MWSTNPQQDLMRQLGVAALRKPQDKYTVPGNPYAGGYNDLIAQLSRQAQGIGPSLADAQYRQRSGEMLQQQLALGRGRSPGAARQASYAGAQAHQGLNQGAAQAALAERLGAQGLLGNVLGGASQQDYLREQLRQQLELQRRGLPTGLDKLMNAGVAIGGAALMGRSSPRA
jgi:hypothetical protein